MSHCPSIKNALHLHNLYYMFEKRSKSEEYTSVRTSYENKKSINNVRLFTLPNIWTRKPLDGFWRNFVFESREISCTFCSLFIRVGEEMCFRVRAVAHRLTCRPLRENLKWKLFILLVKLIGLYTVEFHCELDMLRPSLVIFVTYVAWSCHGSGG